jgi:CheY-like chemotaxis protein
MTCHQILIVEDDAGIRESMRELLEIEGYDVKTAVNGADALDKVAALDRPCLILLDLMMPVMDGWQFLEAINAADDRGLGGIPVTVVSAAADLSQVKHRYGCEVLTKPVNIDRLLGLAEQFCGCPH